MKAEHEIREVYLTQSMVDVKEGLNGRQFHQHSHLLSYPEKWDWREKGFVTDVSTLTHTMHAHTVNLVNALHLLN